VNPSFNLLKLRSAWTTLTEKGQLQNFQNKIAAEVEPLLAQKEVELVEVAPLLSLPGNLHDRCRATKLT
jgi:hypothetical protein